MSYFNPFEKDPAELSGLTDAGMRLVALESLKPRYHSSAASALRGKKR